MMHADHVMLASPARGADQSARACVHIVTGLASSPTDKAVTPMALCKRESRDVAGAVVEIVRASVDLFEDENVNHFIDA